MSVSVKRSVIVRTLDGVGAFFYDTEKSTTHFHPLDCPYFFALLQAGCDDKKNLARCLFSEFEISENESIQIAEDTLNSLEELNLIQDSEIAA